MRRVILWLMTACLCVIGGCAKRSSGKVHPVRGLLLVDGRPAANANIAFHPVKPEVVRNFCPVGVTRPDGTFELTTFADRDGAPPGDYVVTVIWRDTSREIDECECLDPTQHDRFQGLYADVANSPLRAVIRPARNLVALTATIPPPRKPHLSGNPPVQGN